MAPYRTANAIDLYGEERFDVITALDRLVNKYRACLVIPY